MDNILGNIAGKFEVEIADNLIIKLVLAISFIIVLFFILKTQL